ncbi:MAG: enoyl-CoA hydratase-related protein, partial [Proteobacteria bacterium]|nr:enoyl-CoA hydratase-related protein [Pseudomonadota bacterium]
ECDDADDIRAVVLTGAPQMFCLGGDLKSFVGAGDALKSKLKEITADLHAGISRRLAVGPTRAYGAVKSLLNASFENGLETQMELEARAIADMSATADGREGVAAFIGKRKPQFTGR